MQNLLLASTKAPHLPHLIFPPDLAEGCAVATGFVCVGLGSGLVVAVFVAVVVVDVDVDVDDFALFTVPKTLFALFFAMASAQK